MPDARKKPCRICLRWFYPDPRVGNRQRACANAACQASRRQKTQAGWRRQNAGYGVAYRIDQRHRQSEPEPLRVPAPLNKLPWDLAKDEFGGKGADFIGVACTLLLRAAKDQSRGYPIDPTGVPSDNPVSPRKTSPQLPHTQTRAASTRVSSVGPPPGAPPGAPPGTPQAPPRFAG
jgi:hypothetical protein